MESRSRGFTPRVSSHSAGPDVRADFDQFARSGGERARRALVAYYGVEAGTEAFRHAMAAASEQWSEVSAMTNPVGFVVRLGRAHGRSNGRWLRRRSSFPSTDRLLAAFDGSMVDLFGALAQLRREHRAALMLVKAYGYSHQETAAVLEIPEASVANYARRGLARLRWFLEVE